MTDVLPKEVRDGLEAARRRDLRRSSGLRLWVGDRPFDILRFWDGGFALDAGAAPPLRGLVDIYRGPRHVYQCLVVAGSEEDGEMVYEFKRHTATVDRAPLDFAREEPEAAGLIEDRSAQV